MTDEDRNRTGLVLGFLGVGNEYWQGARSRHTTQFVRAHTHTHTPSTPMHTPTAKHGLLDFRVSLFGGQSVEYLFISYDCNFAARAEQTKFVCLIRLNLFRGQHRLPSYKI